MKLLRPTHPFPPTLAGFLYIAVVLDAWSRRMVGWLMRKHKKLAGHKTRAAETLKRLAQRQPRAFVHWSMGYLS